MASKESPYKVSPLAENILDIILKVFLIIIIVGAIITAIVGIVIAINEEEWAPMLLVLAAAGAVGLGYIVWALGKVVINISRNLYNINDALRGGGTTSTEAKEKEVIPSQNEEVLADLQKVRMAAAKKVAKEEKNENKEGGGNSEFETICNYV